MFLQVLHLDGDGWLTDFQCLSCPGESPLARHCVEDAQLVEIEISDAATSIYSS